MRVRDLLTTYGPALLLLIGGFWLAHRFVGPPVPDKIRMSAGRDGGAYQLFAEKYRAELARDGIELEIVPSVGSVQNLERLERGEVDLALVQGGTASKAGVEGLASLGSMFFEPLWIFVRRELDVRNTTELDGKRIAIGVEGSGTRALALTLLADNGIDDDRGELLDVDATEAARRLRAGTLDAAFVTASVSSPMVVELAMDPALNVLPIERATAYERRHRYLSRLVVPQGLIDLQHDVPKRDTPVVAATANLVVGDGFHPALVDLLLITASRIHGPGALLEEPGQFPSERYLEFPLDDDAARYFSNGPPFLQRYLPFWAATMVDRMKVMLLPVIALLLPMIRLMPPIYQWRIRARIYRWYTDLRALDPDRSEPFDEAELDRRLAKLARVESEVKKVSAPLSYTDQLYNLLLHIALVRDALEERAGFDGD